MVHTQNARAIDAMGKHAAVERTEDGLERLVLIDEALLVSAFLSDIDANAHRSHDRAVDVVERRFVGGEQTVAFRSLHGFFRNARPA